MDKISPVKRALLITGIYPPDIGGPATYIPQVETYLRRKGWAVVILTVADFDQEQNALSDSVMRVRRSLALPWRMIVTIIRGFKMARGANIILANGLYEEAAFISLLSGTPMVAKIVGNPVWERLSRTNETNFWNEDKFIDFADESLKLRSSMRMKFWLWSLQRASELFVPGIVLKEHLEHLGVKTRIRVIPNGVSEVQRKDESKEVDVISVSRLVPWKNIDILIESAHRYEFSVEVVGEGPQLEALQKLARGNSKIRFLGKLSPGAVQARLKKARVFALLSNYEGMSFSLVEALSLGTPCVVSDIRSNMNVIADGGGVAVPLRDAKSTGKVIRELLDNSDELSAIGKLAVTNVTRNFLSDSSLEKVERMLNQHAR